MWTNAASNPTAPSTSSTALTIQTDSVRHLYDNELLDLETDLGLRTPNGIIVRHFDPNTSRTSFRRAKPVHRRDSWEEQPHGVRLHIKPAVPKWRETGRNKFAPISAHGYRH